MQQESSIVGDEEKNKNCLRRSVSAVVRGCVTCNGQQLQQSSNSRLTSLQHARSFDGSYSVIRAGQGFSRQIG